MTFYIYTAFLLLTLELLKSLLFGKDLMREVRQKVNFGCVCAENSKDGERHMGKELDVNKRMYIHIYLYIDRTERKSFYRRFSFEL